MTSDPPVISFLPLKDSAANASDRADEMIADALRLKFGDEALSIARHQLECAAENAKDAWEKVVRLLAAD